MSDDKWDFSGINYLAREVHAWSAGKGFWDKERNFGEAIALIHSELSEALEFQRKGNPESDHIPGFSGVAEEVADVIIRVLDLCGGLGLDLEGALKAKMDFNESRPYKHGKQF